MHIHTFLQTYIHTYMYLHLMAMKFSNKDIENTNTEERTYTHKRPSYTSAL